MIKVIIFDADGVLVHSDRRFSVALAEKHGISTETTLPFFSGPFQDCLVGNGDLKETIAQYLPSWGWDRGVDAVLDYWFELEHDTDEELVEYIQGLRKQGMMCLLATNNEKYRFEYMLKRMGFAKSFDRTYSSAHLGHKKPNYEFFQKIFSDLKNIEKNEILFFDDATENIQGAKDFGINADLYESFDDFKDKKKKYLVR
jgi:putative hydrolase of the HAD superfamily